MNFSHGLVQYLSGFSFGFSRFCQDRRNIHPEISWGRLKLRHLTKILEYLFISDPEGKWYFHKSCSRLIRKLYAIVNLTYVLCCGVQDCVNFLSQLSDNLSAQSLTADPRGSVEQKNYLTSMLVPSIMRDVQDHLTAKGWWKPETCQAVLKLTITWFIMKVINYLDCKWRVIINAEPEHTGLPGNYTALDRHANILELPTEWQTASGSRLISVTHQWGEICGTLFHRSHDEIPSLASVMAKLYWLRSWV